MSKKKPRGCDWELPEHPDLNCQNVEITPKATFEDLKNELNAGFQNLVISLVNIIQVPRVDNFEFKQYIETTVSLHGRVFNESTSSRSAQGDRFSQSSTGIQIDEIIGGFNLGKKNNEHMAKVLEKYLPTPPTSH